MEFWTLWRKKIPVLLAARHINIILEKRIRPAVIVKHHPFEQPRFQSILPGICHHHAAKTVRERPPENGRHMQQAQSWNKQFFHINWQFF